MWTKIVGGNVVENLGDVNIVGMVIVVDADEEVGDAMDVWRKFYSIK